MVEVVAHGILAVMTYNGIKTMASIVPSKSIGGGGSGYTYATHSIRLEGIPDPLEGISIDRLVITMVLYFGAKK
jgi:hypothetical protein